MMILILPDVNNLCWALPIHARPNLSVKYNVKYQIKVALCSEFRVHAAGWKLELTVDWWKHLGCTFNQKFNVMTAKMMNDHFTL